MKPLLAKWQDQAHPVIGMVHLRALPGSPGFAGKMSAVVDAAVKDAEAWRQAGADGLIVENFGDVPFFKDEVPRETVASISVVAAEVRKAVPDLPLGINVLRNDGEAALAVAAAVGASYIRINVLGGASLTDQGIIEGKAADIMRYRAALKAEHIKVYADVRVKHASPLKDRELIDEVEELVHRAGADALIVSGSGTGKPTDPSHAEEVKRYAGDTPVLIGSGANLTSIPQLRPVCDGFIIGSAAKPGGRISEPVDVDLARPIVQCI